MKRGWPDFLAVNQTTGEVLAMEVKQKYEHLKPHQQYVRGILENLGIDYRVARIGQEDGRYVAVLGRE